MEWPRVDAVGLPDTHMEPLPAQLGRNLWTLWEGWTSGRVQLGEESRTRTQVDGRTQESRRNLSLKRVAHLIPKEKGRCDRHMV